MFILKVQQQLQSNFLTKHASHLWKKLAADEICIIVQINVQFDHTCGVQISISQIQIMQDANFCLNI